MTSGRLLAVTYFYGLHASELTIKLSLALKTTLGKKAK